MAGMAIAFLRLLFSDFGFAETCLSHLALIYVLEESVCVYVVSQEGFGSDHSGYPTQCTSCQAIFQHTMHGYTLVN